jgi:hypothetical protein
VFSKPANLYPQTGQSLATSLVLNHQRNPKNATTGANKHKPKIMINELTNQPKPKDTNNQMTANNVSQGRR